MCGRRPIQKFEMKKPAAGFPARAFQSSCDDRDMPVICPTCQISSVTADLTPTSLIKSLNRWWRGAFAGDRLPGFGHRQRRSTGGSLLFRRGA
jgi:hypothetical protein